MDTSSMLRSLLNAPLSLAQQLSTPANKIPTIPVETQTVRSKRVKIERNSFADSPIDKAEGSKRPGTAAKHNDATFYPNIMCVLCHEWVCSRNRYLHVESHLQYRPYRCSKCSYDNRKQIFISLHLKRSHSGTGEVIYQPDPQVERRAWEIAEDCLEYTRRLLIGDDNKTNDDRPEMPTLSAEESFRPRIHNALRAEKTELIEQNRQLGLVPVFPPLADHEVECRQCRKHVLKMPYSHLEEHVRLHLSVPSYTCPEPNCWEKHNSRGFMIRHMKEVHSHCRGIVDLMRRPSGHLIFEEFCREAVDCFSEQISTAVVHRVRQRLSHSEKNVPLSIGDAEWIDYLQLNSAGDSLTTEVLDWSPCLGCHIGLTLSSNRIGGVQPCVNCYKRLFEVKVNGYRVQFCQLCHRKLIGTESTWDLHSLSHLDSVPFSCSGCERYEHSDSEAVEEHLKLEHPDDPVGISVVWSNPEAMVENWRLIRSQCFPTLAVQQQTVIEVNRMLEMSCSQLGFERWQLSPTVRATRLTE